MKITTLRNTLFITFLLLLPGWVFSSAPQKQVQDTTQLRRYDYFFLEALRMKEKKQYDSAYELLRHCLQIIPQAPSAMYEISQLCLMLREFNKAEQYMQQAVRLAPDNYWYKQTLANYYHKSDQFEKSIDVYEQMSKQFPSRPETFMALSELYSRTNNFPQMIHALNRIEEIQGKSEMLSMNKFRAYLLMKDYDKAFNEVESLANEYPYDLRYRTILGDLYMQNGKMQEAYNTFRLVLDKEPDNPMALLSLADYYRQTGEKANYNRQIKAILKSRNFNKRAKEEILQQYIKRSEQTDRDSTQVITLLEETLTPPYTSDDLSLLGIYAQYLVDKKMYEQSKPVLNSIIDLDSLPLAPLFHLLTYAVKENNVQEIMRVCKIGIERIPEFLEFHYYLALTHLQSGNTAEAIRILTGGIAQRQEGSEEKLVSEAYGLLGDLYHESGRKAETYAAYDSALVHNPDNIGVLNNYAYFLASDNIDLDKAEQMSYRTIQTEPDNATYLDTYAWILFVTGRYTEAKRYIDQALQNGGMQSGDELEHAGDIYFHCNQPDKALEFWNKAKEQGVKSETIEQKIKLKKYINKP